jgi:c-di-GMP-binding flagellar brake protein YcgR
MPPERRAHRRYIPVETAYAALGAEFSKVGKISDFGLGGLSFEYLDSKISNGVNFTVDIFLVDESFHMHNIRCKVVYDVSIDDQLEAEEILAKRRCGVEFTALSNDQRKEFEFFLSHYILPLKL